jgi:hypothetical protein
MSKKLNKNLHKAKTNKKDEFYTQLPDIEREIKHYKKHFKDKVVFCNCDDPRVSNFFHYFSYNFEKLGIKKLIATCYKNQDMDLFSQNNSEQAIYLEYEGDKNNNRVPDVEEIGIHPLQGDGDFRSEEVVELLKQADIVVTNPPFSLFREYVAQLVEYDKQYLIIGNQNAITYKEIFPLIKDNKMWLGITMNSSNRWFQVPDDYEKYHKEEGGKKYAFVPGVLWFTNLSHSKRNEEVILYKKYNEKDFPKYDNYDAINLDKVKDMPKDYAEKMGVPISFIQKYNPEQFEILGLSRYLKTRGMSKEFVDAYYKSGQTGAISEGHPDLCYYDHNNRPVVPYMRILIKYKKDKQTIL